MSDYDEHLPRPDDSDLGHDEPQEQDHDDLVLEERYGDDPEA